MKSVVGPAACAFAVALATGCGPMPRDFDEPNEGDGGEAGTSPREGANLGGSALAHAGAGNSSTSGVGSAGGLGAGGSHDPGMGGETSEPQPGCPKNSCCLASGTVERDAPHPENPCQSCQPHRDTADWSDRNGELCHGALAEVFSPIVVAHQTRSCGEGGCGDPQLSEPEAEQMLVVTPTTSLDRLHLDFSNLRASVSLGVTKAVVRFSVKAVSAAQPVRVLVSGVPDPLCSYPIAHHTYADFTCDVTNAVKAWMQAPASTERTIALATQNVGNPVMVQSDKAEDAAARPVLLLDYAASCEGDQCVSIERL